jgi:TonB family protein
MNLPVAPLTILLGLLGLARLAAADPVPFPALATPDPEHTPPVLRHRVEPGYPAGVTAPREQRVYVAFHVAPDGRVLHAAAMFNPAPAFAHAAVAAVEQWRFEPGRTRNGKAVTTQMTVEFLFEPGACSPAGPTIADEVLAVQARMNAAAARFDTDAFFADIVDSDETRIIQDGRLFARRGEAMAAVRNGGIGVAKLDHRFEDTRVTVLAPDLALLTGRGTTAVTLSDGRELTSVFAASLLFARRDGRWLLCHGHYSVPNPPP